MLGNNLYILDFFSVSHCIPRTAGRQRGPSIKTLRSPLSGEYWKHCVLSGGTQRRALPRHQSEKMKIKM